MAIRKGGPTSPSSKVSKKVEAQAPPKKVGRPRAKHSDPNYVQMSLYIHKDVRNKVKVRLLESETEREFSGLVESLLREWLATR